MNGWSRPYRSGPTGRYTCVLAEVALTLATACAGAARAASSPSRGGLDELAPTSAQPMPTKSARKLGLDR